MTDSDMLETLRQRINELEAAAPQHESQWQPIETAPRDEQILLYGHYWSDQQGMMQKPLIGMWNANACRWEAAWMCWFGVRPTHWMPLPQHPDTGETTSQTVAD